MADAFEQQQHAQPRNRVGRIDNHAQMGQRVLDVGGFDEFETTALDERDVAALQFEFEIEGMETGAEQHRDFV